jgi:hypothetical protein
MLFRKIVSSLVLVSYTKLVIASSFAVDADFQQASHHLRLSVKRILDEQGGIKGLSLETREGGEEKQALKLSHTTLDLEQCKIEGPDVSPVFLGDGSCGWFEWTVPEIGILKIDAEGRLLLENLHYLSFASVLKIKSDTLITLHNCQIHNLSLNGQSAFLMGGTQLTNLKLKTEDHSGLLMAGRQANTLKNMTVKRGYVRNTGRLQLTSGGIWNLQDHDFINDQQLTVEGEGHTINQARLVDNRGEVIGTTLTVQSKNYINGADSTVALDSFTVQTTQAIANQGKVHLKKKGTYSFGEHFVNDGEMTGDQEDHFTSLTTDPAVELINNRVMRSKKITYHKLKISNHQTIENQDSHLQDSKVENYGSTDLGRLTLKDSQLDNQGRLKVQPVLLLNMKEQPCLHNQGELITHFVEAKDPGYFYQHYILANLMTNSGTLIIDGDYQPARVTRGTQKYYDPIRPGQGQLVIKGALIIPLSRFSEINSFTSPTIEINQITLDGEGKRWSWKQNYNWHFIKALEICNAQSFTFEGNMQVNSASFKDVGRLWIKQLFHVTEGDFRTSNLTEFQVGVDNDHMGKLIVDAGKIDLCTQQLIDARFGSFQAQQEIFLESLSNKIQLGERVTIPAAEVADRLKAKPEELKGWSRNFRGYEKRNDYYTFNGSFIKSDTNKLTLKSNQSIDLTFATLYANQGAAFEAPTVNFVNVNGVIFKSLTIKGQTFIDTRTENYDCGCLWALRYDNRVPVGFEAKVLTSDPTQIYVLGDLNLQTPTSIISGVDFLVSGNFFDASKSLKIKAYDHYSRILGTAWATHRVTGKWVPTTECFYNFINLVSTSGGQVLVGQKYSPHTDDFSIMGGNLSAQLINLISDDFKLEALRLSSAREVSPLVSLDKIADSFAQMMPTIRRTSQGGLTFKKALKENQQDQPEVKRAPYWDEKAQRLTTTYPADVPFYLDQELEQLAFMAQMRSNLGRLYDSKGQSGAPSLTQAIVNALSLVNKYKINEESLKKLPYCYFFYRWQQINGKEFLVPTVHIPQTLEEDKTDHSGALRAHAGQLRAKMYTSIGGKIAGTGDGDSLIETYDQQEAQAAQILGVGTIVPGIILPPNFSYRTAWAAKTRSSEVAERGNIHKTLHQESTLTDHDSRAKGTNTLIANAPVVMTNSTHQGSARSTVQVEAPLTMTSSSITSSQGTTVVKAHSLTAHNLIETIYNLNGYSQRVAHQTTFGGDLGPLFMRIAQDAAIEGVQFVGSSIDFENGGDRHISPTALSGHSVTYGKKTTTITDWCTHLRTTFEATGKENPANSNRVLNVEAPLMCFDYQGENPTQVYEVPISGSNNNCGFNCLGVTRQQAVALLLAQTYDPESRAVVAPEIIAAFNSISQLPQFRNRTDVQALKEQQSLRMQLDQEVTDSLNERLGLEHNRTWKETVAYIQDHNLIDQYLAFIEKANRYLSFEDNLRTFAHKAEIYELYIQTYAGNKMLEYSPDQFDHKVGCHKGVTSTFDLLARLLGKKLRVISRDSTGQLTLKHEDEGEREPVTVLHTVAGIKGGIGLDKEIQASVLNHYNLLLDEEEYQSFLDANSLSPSSSDKNGDIRVYSDGHATDLGVTTTAPKKIFLGCGKVYTQAAVHDWWQQEVIKKKRKRLGGHKIHKSKHSRQTALVNQMTSTEKEEITVSAGEGLVLIGSIFRGGKATVETKKGLIHLLTALNVDCVEVDKKSKDAFWQSRSKSVDYHEQRLPCQFHCSEEDGITFKTPEGIVVELVNEVHTTSDSKHNKGKPETWRRLKDFSNTPGYKWMKLLDARDDVVRIYVDENHQTVHSSQQGMTAVAKIVVTLVVMMCTGGTGGMFATLGKATAATIGGTTGAIVGAAINTTLTTLARSMIVNTIENRGQIDKAAEATFNKDSLKGLGARLIGQALIGGGPSTEANLSDLANTAQEVAQETATSWVMDLQDAFTDSLKSNMASFVGQGIVYGNWRDQLKEAGINTLTDTAAQFGATQIGAPRLKEIEEDLRTGTTDLFNYLSHKISHAALGAATRAANAKLSGGNRKEVKKAAKGGAIGAASAEMLAEAMMPSALERIKTTLQEEGLTKGTYAYAERYHKLFAQELEAIKSVGEIAAVITAQAIGGNIEAAQLAARNALTYNFSLVFTTLQELPTLELKDELTKQLEEAEQARREMARLEHELEGAYAELEKIQDRLELREKARYNSTRAGDLSVAEDVSSLFMHVSTQPHRSPFVQSMQTTLDRIGDLAELYNGFANKIKAVGQSVDNYARQYPHMAEKLETLKGYLSLATAHVPQVTSAAGYAMSMMLGALEGMALGSMAGGIGAAPGAAIGMATGYTSAVVADKVIDASAPHIHSKLSEFADYAQSIGRDELESNRNRYLADAMGNAALTGLAVVGMTRGKPASKSIVSGLDLAQPSRFSFNSKIFDRTIQWTAPTGTKQTYKIYQRNDIKWDMVRVNPKGPREFLGKTNAEAARSGFAPELLDGGFATLHHLNQNGLGNLVEASTRYHGIGKPGQNILHSLYGKSKPHPTNPVDRLNFRKDTQTYWKERTKNESK